MEELIELKIKEAQEILESFDLPEQQQNRLSALTLLSLCSIKPNDEWKDAIKKSMTLSKDIMEFVNKYYDADYKPNTRESFRKIALRPFIDNNIVVLNPDNPNLSPNSSNTHYAIAEIALNAIKSYKTNIWDEKVLEFKKNQFTKNIASNVLLRKIVIKNYKSILNDNIELGRFNVFIGTNGCGKSNILEALAMVGASYANEANYEGLYSRGVRIARPDLIISSFYGNKQANSIDFSLGFEEGKEVELDISLYPEDENIYTRWVNRIVAENETAELKNDIANIIASKLIAENIDIKDIPSNIVAQLADLFANPNFLNKAFISIPELTSRDITYSPGIDLLKEYAIYDLNTKSLRGIVPADSRKTPLGINGEGLDLLITTFNSFERNYLDTCREYFEWLDEIITDKDNKLKSEGLKAGRSTSNLYFEDRYMQKQNNTFSAENSNEGILHVLFYLALFISNKTPELFAIDNIETALNPKLCQAVISELAKLSKERGKQVLITTHNPAILDGLNLLDDEQRLFEVYRTSEGHTRTRRIKFKSDLSDKKHKLSEMWLRGALGAVPKNF